MRTMLRSKVTLLFLSLGMLLAVAGVALADIVVPDADLVTSGNQAGTNANPINMGTVKPGGTLTKPVSFELQCNGTRHVDQGQTVNLTPGAASGVPSGGNATASGTTIGPIPTSWPDDGADCPTTPPAPRQDNGDASVSFTAPTTAANGASYTFSVSWNNNNLTPTGSNDSSSVTGSSQVFFRVTVDAQAPTVTAVSPAENATDVLIGTNVEATFSEAMDAITTDGDPSTINNSTFTLTKPDGPDAGTDPDPVSGVVSYNSATNKATLNPDNDLDYSTTYTATVTTGAEDLVGNALDQNSGTAGNQAKTWTFTTEPPPNTAPVANSDNYNVNEGGTLNVSAPGVLGNDTDDDNDPLTAALVGTGPSNASNFSFNSDGSFVYTHDGSETTTDSFTYKANDGTVDGNTVTVTITVAPVDDPPTAVNDSATVQEDSGANAINVLANDTDVDGGPKTIASKTNGSHGTVAITGGGTGLTYQPDDDYCNDPPGTSPDTFTYTLNGGSTATVSVKVTCVNDAPTQPGPITSTSALNKTGAFTLNWGASSDVDSANITYTLEKRDADDAGWSNVASGLTSNSYTFGTGNALAEGTWDFRVKAVDDYSTPASSQYREALGLVKVDKSNPNAPTLSFATTGQSPKVTVGSVDWYRDSVKVDVSANGDPALSDTSAGSGVDASSFPASFSVTTNGTSTASKTVKDNATNESSAGTLEVNVDAANPTLGASCPTAGPFILNSGGGTQSVGPIVANDGESGVDNASSTLTGTVDTSTVGTKTVNFKAVDNVGHESATKQCSYSVVYNWSGFFAPVDNMPTFNVVKGGSSVPMKFNLGGNQGMGILAAGYPKSISIPCDSTAELDALETVATAGSSGLNFDPITNQYNYIWKTDKTWTTGCRQVEVKLIDGTSHRANFKFTK